MLLDIQQRNRIKWKYIKHIEFQDEDIITAEYVDAYYSENNTSEAHYIATVGRFEMETDKEFEERKKHWKKLSEYSKKERYEIYLK